MNVTLLLPIYCLHKKNVKSIDTNLPEHACGLEKMFPLFKENSVLWLEKFRKFSVPVRNFLGFQKKRYIHKKSVSNVIKCYTALVAGTSLWFDEDAALDWRYSRNIEVSLQISVFWDKMGKSQQKFHIFTNKSINK